MMVVPFKIHFLIHFGSDHDEISMAIANINALYASSLRIKKSYFFFFSSNFTFYKWCVTKMAYCMFSLVVVT